MEAKATTVKAATLAIQFFEELQGDFETLGDIARTHGLVTLTDLMYLHNAILSGGFIDAWPESHVTQVLAGLPSAERWSSYVRRFNKRSEVIEGDDARSRTPPTAPRVLVTVSGGVAEYIADDGVEVVVFDHDDHTVGGKASDVPSRFGDLAQRAGVPVSQ